MALQIRKPSTAFSLQPTGKNSGRVEDKDYLAWIRTLPCAVTGVRPVDAAHISYADNRYGKLGRAKGTKEDDRWAIPLSQNSHREQHSMGERRYWEVIGLDPCIIAMSLWAAYPDDDKARLILEHSVRQAQQKRRNG